MTTANKIQIRKLQATLTKIDNKEHVFFNIVAFENMGLVASKKVTGIDSVGNKVETGHTYHLTTKGRMILNTVI